MYKAGKLGKDISEIALQLIRISVGKSLFMNDAVKVTNVFLRLIVGKGMTYGRNAAFRKFIAKWLCDSEDPYTLIYLIISLIPDIAALINPRDYRGLLNTIMALYLLRNYPDSEKEILY